MLYENGNKVTKVQKRVTEITPEEEGKVCAFLQGAVYCWCETQKDKRFKARYFVGGDNKDWNGTPLQAVFEGQSKKTDPQQGVASGQDIGHLLKLVLMKDKRTFNRVEDLRVVLYISDRAKKRNGIVEDPRVATYAWDGNP